MIERTELLPLSYYAAGSAFTGSYKGMRYKIEVSKDEESTSFVAHTWFGVNAFDHTDSSIIQSKNFEFSEDGMVNLVEWLNEVHSHH